MNAVDRLNVLKTYKLYVGGKFPRSESGRVYEVTDAKGKWLANAPLSSRKDARDAVVAARKAFGGWSGATAYNRGQVLYRVAEMLEGRRDQFTREVADAEGLSKSKAAAVVDATIDRWVWYAGWTDKIAQVVGGGNPVAGPFFNLSSPEPTGVVAVLAPQESSFLGLVSVLAPVIATGNTAVVVASEKSPLPALSLAVGPYRRDRDPAGGPPGRQRDRPRRRRRGPREGTGDRRGRQPEAGRPSTACGLRGDPRDRPSDGVPGDQNGLAPHGVTGRVGFLVLARPPSIRKPRPSSVQEARGFSVQEARRFSASVPPQMPSRCPMPSRTQSRPKANSQARSSLRVAPRAYCSKAG
jgi:hypothetical protein